MAYYWNAEKDASV